MKNLGVVDPRTHGGRHNTPCYAHTRGIKSVSLSDLLQDRMAQATPIHFNQRKVKNDTSKDCAGSVAILDQGTQEFTTGNAQDHLRCDQRNG